MNDPRKPWLHPGSPMLLQFFRVIQNLPGMLAAATGIWLAMSGQAAAAATCIVTPVVAPVFASYKSATNNAIGSITVRCTTLITENVSYTISLGLGNQAVGTQRRMTSNGYFLSYNFFCANDYAQVWADGVGGTCAPTGGGSVLAAFPMNNIYPLYGRIPANQFAAAGTYLDTVMITVLY